MLGKKKVLRKVISYIDFLFSKPATHSVQTKLGKKNIDLHFNNKSKYLFRLMKMRFKEN